MDVGVIVFVFVIVAVCVCVDVAVGMKGVGEDVLVEEEVLVNVAGGGTMVAVKVSVIEAVGSGERTAVAVGLCQG